MARKNPYLVELRRYLAEVSVDIKQLSLEGLAKRVSQAYDHHASSLDICESFEKYAPTSPLWADMDVRVHFQSDKNQNKIQTTYPTKKIPFVPNAIQGRPLNLRPVK
ncbi:MAG: hypothetical protein Q8L27_00225 [archaeon]|nr:hypothetical protein [archaeon]